ncbi:MAG: ribonuclease H-like domain-containing protein [Candidatus Omnitrophica bacterium]|nr:ribonuclease H-like domain-containing protein [Candidatus Omnitrophota bacterium]
MVDRPGPTLVLDLETQNTFADVGGKRNLGRLCVSVVCIYNYGTGGYTSFLEHEMFQLEEALRAAGLIVGFNIRSFDFAVLQNYLFTPADQFPILDLLEEIERVRGHRVTLQSIAEATFNERKTGHGLDAVRLFREGKMQDLIEYCRNDVRLTKDIYDYGSEHGRVFFRSIKDFQIHEVPVSWGGVVPKEKSAASQFPTSLF